MVVTLVSDLLMLSYLYIYIFLCAIFVGLVEFTHRKLNIQKHVRLCRVRATKERGAGHGTTSF